MARGRGKASPQDKEAIRIISEKIRELLKEQGKKQIELSRITGIPASTLTGYVKGTSLPITENLEKIASFFQVSVSESIPGCARILLPSIQKLRDYTNNCIKPIKISSCPMEKVC